MRRTCLCSRASWLLVVFLVGAVIVDQADAKKKKKKNKKKKKSSSSSSRSFFSSSSNNPPAPPSPSAASVVQASSAALAQCEQNIRTQVQFSKQCHQEQKDVVEKHNKLVDEYNHMLHKQQGIIKMYNALVEELQDPSTAQFLTAKAIKAVRHPGIQGAVNKTRIHVLPFAQEKLIQKSRESALWFNKTKDDLQQWLVDHQDILPEESLASVSGMLVYGGVLIPLLVAVYCVIEVVCNLSRLLMFGHVHFTVSSACGAAFAMMSGEDPLSMFNSHEPKIYAFAQASYGFLALCYFIVVLAALNCGPGNTYIRILHVGSLFLFLLFYYYNVWTPAMVDEEPKVEDFADYFVLKDGDQERDVPNVMVALPYIMSFLIFALMALSEPGDASSAVAEEDAEAKDE